MITTEEPTTHTQGHSKPLRDRSAHPWALSLFRRRQRPTPRGDAPARLKAAVSALAALLTMMAAGADRASATYPGTTNGRLAFAIDFGGNADIYSVMPNGEGLRRLTDNSGFDACPAYSADGKQIAYCSGVQTAGGVTEIWVMKANGTQQRQVTTIGGRVTFPDFSPDGAQIVFAGMEPGATNADVFVIGSDGSGLVQLTNTPTNDRFPAWSPDGSRIAFVSDRTGVPQIWLMNANGSDPRQLTFDPARKDQVPDWSPDGTMIAYATLDPALGSDIWIVNADGTGQRRVTNDQARQIGAAWSPDGTQIAFLNNDDRFVYVINADGTGQHVVRPHGVQFVAAWQPRGRRIR
jgi:Tol biopolymer transport system component